LTHESRFDSRLRIREGNAIRDAANDFNYLTYLPRPGGKQDLKQNAHGGSRPLESALSVLSGVDAKSSCVVRQFGLGVAGTSAATTGQAKYRSAGWRREPR
jgi:hypothetical protein